MNNWTESVFQWAINFSFMIIAYLNPDYAISLMVGFICFSIFCLLIFSIGFALLMFFLGIHSICKKMFI